MINCPICEKDLKSPRALHAHMLKSHIDEYRAKGCKISNFGIEEKFETVWKKKESTSIAPEDFRTLDLSNPLEREAYSEGYCFVSDGNVYTIAECKEKGWI